MPSPPHPDLGDQNPLAVGLGLAGRQPVRLHRRSCRGRPLGTRDLANEARSGLACCPPSRTPTSHVAYLAMSAKYHPTGLSSWLSQCLVGGSKVAHAFARSSAR